ncbi:TPA: ribosome assembly factor SBDS, partial [Candidatus Woesearchaeota archaeon]|nr:ribosome assembly factor SBDS [Candidatus Woesearchaeota archaeon]
MSEKLSLARIKRNGETFEISINTDKALEYKKGNASLSEVLLADQIFTNAKKGQVASQSELQNAFETSDTDKVADIILTKGEVQVTSEHRAQEREQRRKKLVHMINQQAVDPKTGLPHPVTRIELAMEQGKIHVDDNKPVEEQFDSIIAKLRPIIPISIEKKELVITIPGSYAGKMQQLVRKHTVKSEDWKSDGSWVVTVELPAGMAPDFISELNNVTHGEVI